MKHSILVTVMLMLFLGMDAFGQEKISVFDETVVERDNFQPAIPRPKQENIANQKLKDLEAKTGKKPNILIFIVDDLGYGDPGCYGGGTALGAPTPNIDKLAYNGKKFTSFYVTPTCTPSRAALFTGRLPQRSGLTRPILKGDKIKNNPWKIEVSQAKLLSNAGYNTALIGKWHVGEGEGQLPHEIGFDYWYGLPAATADYSMYLVKREYSDMLNRPEMYNKAKEMRTPGLLKGRKGGPTEVAFPITTIAELRQMEELLHQQSIDFLNENAGTDKPFFLVHSFAAIHNDTYCGEDYIGKSPSGMPVRDAFVEVDDIIGDIMKKLKEKGELENTLVIFTSDNGANEDTFPDSGYQPWRGGKGTTWDGGVRVPGIAYWEGMIEPGQESNELIDIMDLYMISLRLGGVSQSQLPTNLYYDGIDQTSYLLTKDGHSRRQAEFIWAGNELCAIRWKDYKVHFKVFDTKVPRRNIDASVLVTAAPSPWVFNLTVDPKEQASEGHRWFEWGLPSVLAFQKRHLATMKKFQNTDLGLGL